MDEPAPPRIVEWQGPERLDLAGSARLVELLATGLERLLLAQKAEPRKKPDLVDFNRDLCVYTDHGCPDGAEDG
jgi:hypothetical protein